MLRVPATMTAVPTTIGTVTISPSRTMASVVETNGFRLMSEAAIDAPTRSIETNEPEQSAYDGADQADEHEEEGAASRHATQAAGDENRGPQARCSDQQVDPEAREWIARAEP